ncbi:MAG: dipeptide ABC transporter ATP-binding protein [Pararhizobium sp.]
MGEQGGVIPARKTDLLRVEDLRIAVRTFQTDVEVVRGVSFRIHHGRTVALVGETGSGKSIIAQAILGILPQVATITGGSILFDDPADAAGPIDIAALDPDGAPMRALRGGRISIIFQEPMTSLSPVHTIGNQVEEALRLHRDVKEKDARRTTEEMLGLVGFPDPHAAYGKYASELSGGLRQRAMIAMALICHPALLIADEPTTALDVTIQAQVLAVLRSLQEKLGMSLLLITHDLGVVANMADEVVVVWHGRVMEAGPMETVFSDPRHPYLKALLAAVPRVHMAPGERLKSLRDIEGELPESMRPAARPKRMGPGAPLLTVENLSKTYRTPGRGLFGGGETTVRAVDGVSFSVRRGECFGLVGESGCGKSTVSKMLSRAISADGGSAIFDDGREKIDILKLRGRALARFHPHVQMVFQDPFSSLSPRSTILNILTEPLEIHGRGSPRWRRERASDLLQLVGLPPTSLGRYPHSFSGGQRQRIGIARALALDPDLLICDEPVSALDVSVQAQILNLLMRLQDELGLTSIFISHNLAVVNYIADRIGVMRRGRLVEVSPRGVLFDNPVHPYTKRLLRSIPTIDLDRKLDLDAALAEAMGDEEDAWDPAFLPNSDGTGLGFVEVGPDHVVLARPGDTVRRRVA